MGVVLRTLLRFHSIDRLFRTRRRILNLDLLGAPSLKAARLHRWGSFFIAQVSI